MHPGLPYPPPRRPRWPLVLAIVVPIAAAAVAVVIVVAVTLARIDGDAPTTPVKLPPIDYRGEVGVPGQELLPSLRARPVPKWRVDVQTLVPPEVEAVVSYAVSNATTAFFTVDDRALVGPLRSWLVGIDIDTGAVAFAPVEFADSAVVSCVLNGPRRLLCIDSTDGRLFVIDADSGAVLHRGTTDVRVGGSGEQAPAVLQVGEYAFVWRKGVGASGIGNRGEPTWTIPGGDKPPGIIPAPYYPGDPATTIATVTTDEGTTVFSVADGDVLADKVRGSVILLGDTFGTWQADDSGSSGVYRFYDRAGDEVGQYRPPAGWSATTNGFATQLPIVQMRGRMNTVTVVLSTTGQAMQQFPAGWPAPYLRFIGDAVFVDPGGSAQGDPRALWHRYDLRSGEELSQCPGLPLSADEYLGSDGTVVIGRFGYEQPVVAVDTETCAELWRMDPPKGVEQTDDIRVLGDTFVELPPDTAEIVAFASPG